MDRANQSSAFRITISDDVWLRNQSRNRREIFIPSSKTRRSRRRKNSGEQIASALTLLLGVSRINEKKEEKKRTGWPDRARSLKRTKKKQKRKIDTLPFYLLHSPRFLSRSSTVHKTREKRKIYIWHSRMIGWRFSGQQVLLLSVFVHQATWDCLLRIELCLRRREREISAEKCLVFHLVKRRRKSEQIFFQFEINYMKNRKKTFYKLLVDRRWFEFLKTGAFRT